jgi:hypothetical protein
MKWRKDKEGGGKVAIINGVKCRIRERVRGLLFAYANDEMVGEFRSLREAEVALVKRLEG